jgi:TP901 family phage tail tape measure protein
LKEATGIADRDMMSFMDTIARTANVGVESGEMQYAFARSAGALKLMNMQGLETSKSVSAVYAMLIKTGASGETVGTGMTAVFNSFMNNKKMAALQDETRKLGITMDFVDKQTGQFKGVENMVAQFDRLKGLNPQQRANIVQAFLGPGADANFMNVLIDKGVAGYNEMIDRMKNQADLNAKVESQLAGQKAMWEAASGTFENVLAMVGDLIGEDVKDFFTLLNNSILPTLSKWIDENKTLVKIMAYSIGVFTAVAGTLAGIGFGAGLVFKGISAVSTGMSLFMRGIKAAQFAMFAFRYTMAFQVMPTLISFNAALIANPIGAVVAAIVIMIAAIAILVIKWKEITKWYRESATWVKIMLIPLMLANSAIILIAFSIRKLIDSWPAIKAFFAGLPKLVSGLYAQFKAAGVNIAKSIWEGIKAGANYPVEAISNLTKKMREYLPFSPAKRGAFMDLHKVKIVETIAGSMRPAPLVKAMGNTTKAALGAGKSGGASGGGITLNFNPVFNGISNPDEIKKMLKAFVPELLKEIESKMSRKATLSF